MSLLLLSPCLQQDCGGRRPAKGRNAWCSAIPALLLAVGCERSSSFFLSSVFSLLRSGARKMVQILSQGLISRIAKWHALSTVEKGLFLWALCLLLGVRCLLKLLPFRIWRPLLMRFASAPDGQEAGRGTRDIDNKQHVAVSQVTRAVEQASRFIPGVKCLARALTTGILLRRYGFDPCLRLGVKLETASGFTAHAWVVCGGAVVIGKLVDLEEYNLLPLREGIPL